jgi:hypothetical protein
MFYDTVQGPCETQLSKIEETEGEVIKIKARCTKVLECTRASTGVYLCRKHVFTQNKNLQY